MCCIDYDFDDGSGIEDSEPESDASNSSEEDEGDLLQSAPENAVSNGHLDAVENQIEGDFECVTQLLLQDISLLMGWYF